MPAGRSASARPRSKADPAESDGDAPASRCPSAERHRRGRFAIRRRRTLRASTKVVRETPAKRDHDCRERSPSTRRDIRPAPPETNRPTHLKTPLRKDPPRKPIDECRTRHRPAEADPAHRRSIASESRRRNRDGRRCSRGEDRRARRSASVRESPNDAASTTNLRRFASSASFPLGNLAVARTMLRKKFLRPSPSRAHS